MSADALARDGDLAVFVRSGGRWNQTGSWQAAATQDGRLLEIDTAQAIQDGTDNVLVIALDSVHSGRLLFDAKGLPGETFFLDLEGRVALEESFALFCDTPGPDGQVRPALWRCVDDLYACGSQGTGCSPTTLSGRPSPSGTGSTAPFSTGGKGQCWWPAWPSPRGMGATSPAVPPSPSRATGLWYSVRPPGEGGEKRPPPRHRPGSFRSSAAPGNASPRPTTSAWP